MRSFISLCLLLLSFLVVKAQPLTNVISAPTNLLAIHLVAYDDSPPTSPATLESLKLEPQPILADSDFVAWDVVNHTFVITPAAAMRVIGRCTYRILPFVLLAEGERIYFGKFGSGVSSSSEDVPVILTDYIVSDCFMGSTNVPDDISRMIGRADPEITNRLMAWTNATTNVTLQIDGGYHSGGHGVGPDLRGDARISIAVEKLFAGRKNDFVFSVISAPSVLWTLTLAIVLGLGILLLVRAKHRKTR